MRHFFRISAIGVIVGLYFLIFFLRAPQVQAQYTCSGITYTIPSATGNYYVNPGVPNTSVDISRCTATSPCGWNNVGFKIDAVPQPGGSINGPCGYIWNFNTGAPGLHTMQFTTCSGAASCNTQQFCTLPVPPQNLTPVTGTYTAGTYTITWNPSAGATSYPIRIDDLANGWVGNCSLPQNPGDICNDSNSNTFYTYTFLAGHSYNVWVHAVNCGWSAPSSVSLTFVAPTPTPTPTLVPVPNCLNVTVPGGTLLTNTTYTISASYANGTGPVNNRAIQVVNNTCTTSYFSQFSSGGPGTVNYSWTTPNTPGTYYVQCRAWNDGFAECRGYNPCVVGPKIYLCAGPQAFVSVNIAAPTPTPTPQTWSKIYGGDVYQRNVNGGNTIPLGNLFLNEITGGTNTVGVVQSPNGLPFSINNLSTPKWFASPITNLFSFDSYLQTLTPLAINVTGTVVGNSSDLTPGSYVYSYTCGATPCTLNTSGSGTSFIGSTNLVIYLINGDLSITSNFTLPSNNVAVFVVDGSVQVAGDVGNIAGLYVVNNTFNVAQEPGAPGTTLPLSINGSILTNALSLNREYRNSTTPTYQFTFQPQYAVKLIPFLGKSQINWQELAP